MGISWWMAPNSRYSSGLAFTATRGLTRIETTHWTARCVVYLPVLLWSDLSQLVTLPDSLVVMDYAVGHTGSVHDALAFRNTRIFKEHDHILAPNEWVWADTAYPIETWCVAPFRKPVGGELSADQRTYNYHVSRVSHALFIFVSLQFSISDPHTR